MRHGAYLSPPIFPWLSLSLSWVAPGFWRLKKQRKWPNFRSQIHLFLSKFLLQKVGQTWNKTRKKGKNKISVVGFLLNEFVYQLGSEEKREGGGGGRGGGKRRTRGKERRMEEEEREEGEHWGGIRGRREKEEQEERETKRRGKKKDSSGGEKVWSKKISRRKKWKREHKNTYKKEAMDK